MGTLPQASVLKGPARPLISVDRLHHLFQDTARKWPNEKVFIYNDIRGVQRETTYAEADAKSNQLSRAILSFFARNGQPKANADGDRIVAVGLPPSDDLILVLLAVWKCGFAYLPLDSNAPKERTKHILNESKPVLVVTVEGADETEIPFLSLEALQEAAVGLDSTKLSETEVYGTRGDAIEMVLYTSGSTGLSKGVRIKKSSVLNRLQWQWATLPYSSNEKVFVFKTALTFVDSVSEIWGPLLCPDGGAKALLVVPREITTNPQRLVHLLNKFKIQRMVLVPSLLKAILLYLGLSKENENLLDSLKIWVCSGEPLPVSLAQQFFDHFGCYDHLLYNFYGSTEIMGDVTFHAMKSSKDVPDSDKVPIGVPLDNTIIYLLNEHLKTVPLGELGEIYVGGKNITEGYVNQRDAVRFIRNPYCTDQDFEKLYRTGDFAKFVKGTIIYEGRTDSQVKVRGHRVDLSEVEAALLKSSKVEKGVVLCYNPGEEDQQIVAFVLPVEGPQPNPFEIEQGMTNYIPKYAIPQVHIVSKMPYLINGKVDRQTLMAQYRNSKMKNGKGDAFDFTGVSPSTHLAAECLFRTVSEVLGSSARGKISRDSSFFTLGGNSLNSVMTISSLKQQGYTISITDFIKAANLGEVIDKMSLSDSSPSELNPNKYKLEILADEHKEDVYEILTYSFYNKGDIESIMDPPIQEHEYIPLFDGLWPALVRDKLSLVVRDSTGEVVAASLILDLFNEPEDLEIHGQLGYVFELLDYIECPIKERLKHLGKLAHSFMLGTKERLNAQENVEITNYMEEETVTIAKQEGCNGIIATNTSPLTQQLAEMMDYKVIKSYQVNEYVAQDGTRPFRKAPDELHAVCCLKKL